jgi:hypothetical protein
MKTFWLIPESKKDLLGDVLSLRLIVQDLAGEPIDGATVAPIHLGEGHLAETRDERHELGVAGLS